jgi:hypothetical protein
MDEFEDIVTRERSGALLVGVDRVFARKFFTDVKVEDVIAHTGQGPYVQKALVLGAFVVSPLALIGSSIVAVFAAGWWAVILIPLGVVLWALYQARSCVGGARITFISVLLAGTALGYAQSAGGSARIWFALLLFALSLWTARFVYTGATAMLRAFVLGNERAFSWLREYLTIRVIR